MIRSTILSTLLSLPVLFMQFSGGSPDDSDSWVPPVQSGPVSPYAADVDDAGDDEIIVSPYSQQIDIAPQPVPDDVPDTPMKALPFEPGPVEHAECDCPTLDQIRDVVREELDRHRKILIEYRDKDGNQVSMTTPAKSDGSATAEIPAGAVVTHIDGIPVATPVAQSFSNGSGGGSTGGSTRTIVPNRVQYSVPMTSPVYETPLPIAAPRLQRVRSIRRVAATKRVVSRSNYTDPATGCTHTVTRYSDDSTTDVVTQCPANGGNTRRTGLLGRLRS